MSFSSPAPRTGVSPGGAFPSFLSQRQGGGPGGPEAQEGAPSSLGEPKALATRSPISDAVSLCRFPWGRTAPPPPKPSPAVSDPPVLVL